MLLLTKRHCTEIFRKMARDAAASREKEKMIKSVLGGDSTMPSLERMLCKAVFAGLLKKYEANCEIDDCPSSFADPYESRTLPAPQ